MAEITGPFPLPGFVVDLAAIAAAGGHAQAARDAALSAAGTKETVEQLAIQAGTSAEIAAVAAYGVPFQGYADALAGEKPVPLRRVSAICAGRIVTWLRETGGPCLGGGWSPEGDVTPLHFGAVVNGETDDAAPIQDAIEYIATLGGGTIHFPEGVYRVTNAGAALRIKSTVAFVGVGKQRSIIQFDDSASTSRRDCFRVFNDTGDFDISFRDLTVRGDWGTGGLWTSRSHLMELHTTGAVTLRDCCFSDSRYMATVIVDARRVHVSGCDYLRICADGCRPVGCDNVTVENNFFQHVNDDCIAVHALDREPSPVQNAATITGNRILDSQGIAVLGAKHVTVTGNSLTRIHTRAILVGGTNSVEGNTALLSVTVTGNVIDTVFNGSKFSALTGAGPAYILVDAPNPTALGGAYAGQRNGSGGILSPIPYFYTNDTDAAAPTIGAWMINITGNVCVRSLGPVAHYSDYGCGARYGRSGPADPEITPSDLGYAAATTPKAGIAVYDHGCGVRVSDNIVSGIAAAVYFYAATSSPYTAWRDCEVVGNQLSDFVAAGVYVQGPGNVSIKGTTFNGDPNHTHASRLANGKWDGATADNCPAIWADTGRVAVEGCDFRNVSTIYRGANPADAAWRGNTLFCNPAAGAGWNADNIGIGVMPRLALLDAQVVVEDGDPASTTYGLRLNVCANAATAMPASGKYPAGYVVRNGAPAVLGTSPNRYVVSGWARLTTGSGHVLGTDWVELRSRIE